MDSNLKSFVNATLTELDSAARNLRRAADLNEQYVRTVRDSLERGLNVPSLGQTQDLATLAERVNSLARVAVVGGVAQAVVAAVVRGHDDVMWDYLESLEDAPDQVQL